MVLNCQIQRKGEKVMAFIGILLGVLLFFGGIVIFGLILFVISMILRKKKKKYKILMAFSLILIGSPFILFVTASFARGYTKMQFNNSVAGAVYAGDLERTQKLLEKGADPDYDEYVMREGEILHNEGAWREYHPLNYACINNDVQIVELLLKYNATADRYVWNDVIKNESYDAAKALLQNNAYSQEELEDFLENATYDYNVEIVRILLEYGIDLKEAILDGMDYDYINNLYNLYRIDTEREELDEEDEKALGEILSLFEEHLQK